MTTTGSTSNTATGGSLPVALTPRKGGTLTAPMATQPRSMDFHFDVFVPTGNHTTNALLKFNADVTQVEIDAAQALPEQPAPLTYVFKLQPAIKFHNVDPVNGRELTTEDVKFSIERQRTDEAGTQNAYFFRGKVAKIEATDKYTVKFAMTKPFAPFIAYVANAWTLITAPETVSKFGDLTQVGIGTSPFIFKEWQNDVRIDFVRNPDYFRPNRPYVDALTYLVRPDPDEAPPPATARLRRTTSTTAPRMASGDKIDRQSEELDTAKRKALVEDVQKHVVKDYPVSRTIRSAVPTVKSMTYVEAARATGATDARMIFAHVLPNVVAPIMTLATLGFGAAILAESGLSFLGLGVPPDVPSWGGMLNREARSYMTEASWLALAPGLALSLAVFGFTMLGDALRDLLDPRMRGSR